MSVGASKTISLRVPSDIYDRAMACFPATDASGFAGRIREIVEAAILVAEKGNDPARVLHDFDPVLANRAIKAIEAFERIGPDLDHQLERLEAATPFLLAGLGVKPLPACATDPLQLIERIDLLIAELTALNGALEAAHFATAQIDAGGRE
jgi:hypothetical protein